MPQASGSKGELPHDIGASISYLVKKINATPCVLGVAFTLSKQPIAFYLGVAFVFPSDSYYFDASGESHVEEQLPLLHHLT